MNEEISLLATTAKVNVLEDQVKALQTIMFSALLLLHDRGTLPVQVLISKVQFGTAFLQGAHDMQPPELLEAMLDHLSVRAGGIAPAVPPSGPTSPE